MTLAKKIITLYIDDSSLRLTETHGRRMKKWAYLPLDPGIIANNVVANEPALAEKIRELFSIAKIREKRTAVGLSGLHCLSRPLILPQLPRDMLDEAVGREAKGVLPISPGQFYLSWQTIPAPEKKSAVLLVALPRSTVDTVVSTLRRAGLEANFIGIKPLLVSGALNKTTAIIIDVQLTEFDITIITNGIPQTLRTVSFPDGTLSAENKIEIIRSELERTINFYNSSNPKDILTPDVPVYASGKLTEELRLHQSLSSIAEHPVQPLRAPIESPDGCDPDMYLVNMGLTLQQLKGGTKLGSPLVTLNSLPTIYQTKQVSLINVVAIPGAVISIGLIAFFVVMTQNIAANISSTGQKMNTAQQILQQSLAYRADLSADTEKLKGQIVQTEKSYADFESALNSIQGQRTRIKGDLLETIQSLPSAITLSSLKHNGNTLVITGIAQTKRNILQYLQDLKDSSRFGEILVSRMTMTKDGVMEFTLSVNLEKQDTQTSAIQVVLASLPANVSLASVNQAKDVITIDARAENEDSIVLFLKALEDSNIFKQVTLTGKTNTQDGGLDFTLVVKT